MKIILLSGGSGKRLWPLSNASRSKQFLKILTNTEGQMESMIQRVWRQLNQAGLGSCCMFTAGAEQVDLIASQIGHDIPMVVEPERRDTFPAIALACTYLYSEQAISPEETIVVLPVDSFVEDGFFHLLKEFEQVLQKSSAKLALMGVEPTYPSAKYGYIVPEHSNDHGAEYRKVKSFQEKPTEEEATELIDVHKALWNCGVFAFKLDDLITLLYDQGIPIPYKQLLRDYGSLRKTSFDYEIVERTKDIVVLPYKGAWKDLGTWNTLTEEISSAKIGEGIISLDSPGTHIINELKLPLSVIGVTDSVIVASPDGILVAKKSASPRLKEVLRFEQKPMTKQYHWGTSRVLGYCTNRDGEEVLTQRIIIRAGTDMGIEIHHKRTKVWHILTGIGELELDEELIVLQANAICKIPPNTKHRITAVTDLELMEVQIDNLMFEEKANYIQ
jgi:mannose-1-phosphate guanylyltransferase